MLLVVLLAIIAVLLGVVISLLPESTLDHTLARDADPPADIAREEPAQPDAERQPPADRQPETDPEAGDRREPAPAPSRPVPAVPTPVPEAYPEAPPAAAPTEPRDTLWWLPATRPAPGLRGPLVLVLDDAGYSLDAFDRFLRFPGPLAVAILPQLDYSVQAAALTAAAGKEIMLHQPMAPLRGGDPGPGVIGPSDSREVILETVRMNLATVPGAIGVNNHMGSLATTDATLMRTLLGMLHARNLFFLDSRTTAETVGRAVAAEIGIPFAERAVFLDNWRTRESILASLKQSLELTHRGEPVVMIGHVTVPLLADILLEVYPTIIEHGYEFVAISSLVRPVHLAMGADR